MLDLSTEQKFKPLPNPRKPEIFFWVSFAAIFSVIILIPTQGFVRIGSVLLAIFFFLAALALSIGNWMNRKTILTLSKSRVRFSNGLQDIAMVWENIERVEVFQGRVNDKIVVKSSDQHFAFDLYREVLLNGKSGGAVGFEQGEEILETIFEKAEIDTSHKHHAEGYDYYLRK